MLNGQLSSCLKEEQLAHSGDKNGTAIASYINRLAVLNLNAHADIEQAYLAYLDYMASAEEISEKMEKDGADGWNLETATNMFPKVPAKAVARMRRLESTGPLKDCEKEPQSR